ncbi:complement C3-like isoform X3 [Engraulis encrasicolus]|uniref:complement C3-like isoform X3 n=1 Tax=Engraulis encrasicolus TaxID=184585 RepID=UPI002FCEA1B2
MDGRMNKHFGMQQVVMEVWLVVAILYLPTLTQCSPLFVMSAPNPLRVGAPEKVFVEAQDYAGGAFDITVRVKDFPFKTKLLAEQTLQLSQNNNYQALAEITIPMGDGVFDDDRGVNQYMYLIAQFPGKVMERVVLVSFQSGYIFVQTDKTIYTPSSTVRYRIYSLDVSMKPSEEPVTVDVVDAEGAVVSREDLTPHKGVCSGDYKLQAFGSTGTWTIVTRFKSTPQNNFTYNFEVKNYVLPQVEIMLSLQKSHFYIDDEELMVNITARYLNGMEVTGAAFIEFSLQHLETDHRSVAVATQRVKINGGMGHAAMTRQHLLQVSPGTDGIQHLTGALIHVNVTVVSQTGYETAHANSGIQIVTSPYTLHFKKTHTYFKPGLLFDVMLLVRNVDGSPAEGVQMQLSNRKSSDDITGTTGSNGLVKLTVNTDIADSSLAITATTKDPDLIDERQARQSMTAFPYESTTGSKNYLHIGISDTELMLGDQVKVDLIVKRSPGVENQDLTYLILSKGHLLQAERIKSQGQSVVSLSLTVTKDMAPSFRIVAYYHVGSSEVVSDSVWVDVKDTCIGKLVVKQSGPGEVYFQTRLEITGDPGAKVGLVAVDKGVYILNNKHRLSQTKIWDVIERQDTGCTAGSGENSMEVFYDAGLLFETSTAGGTNSRTGYRCPSHQRRQRSLEDDDKDAVIDILDDVIPRSHFQESFFWSMEQLPICAYGEQNWDITVTEGLSGWVISAVSLSEASGLCVADPIEISRTKALFTLDLKVPAFSKCNEQLEVMAILHNPEDEDIKSHIQMC